MKKYKVIVFDWDGTLANSISIIIKSYKYAFTKLNLTIPPDEVLKSLTSLGSIATYHALLPYVIDENFPGLIKYYKEYFFSPKHTTELFLDVKIYLPKLKEKINLPFAIATNKGRFGLNKALQDTGVSDLFSITKTINECEPKPASDMLMSISHELGYTSEDILLVGDSVIDLETANNSNIDALALTTGAQTFDELSKLKPIAILNNFKEFYNLF